MILVTSRSQDKRVWGRHAELHRVGWLERTEGASLLTDLAPHAGTPAEAAALAERLGGLPLALHHAGSQLSSDFAAERTASPRPRLSLTRCLTGRSSPA